MNAVEIFVSQPNFKLSVSDQLQGYLTSENISVSITKNPRPLSLVLAAIHLIECARGRVTIYFKASYPIGYSTFKYRFLFEVLKKSV